MLYENTIVCEYNKFYESEIKEDNLKSWEQNGKVSSVSIGTKVRT